MKRVLLLAGTALLIGFSPAMAAKVGGGGGGGGGGGASFSHSSGGGGGLSGSAMSHAAPSGGVSGNFSARSNAGTFSGNNMSGPAHMGGMDHDRGHGHDHDGRFRGNFAFGFYPGYDYNAYDYDYDPGCYQLRQVHTRYGWRWRQIWVCD